MFQCNVIRLTFQEPIETMKGVILDKSSFDKNDIVLTGLEIPEVDWTSYPATRVEQTLERVSSHQIVITNKVVLDRDLLHHCPNLKLILIAATGTDNVALDTCREQGIVVCNVRHYATPAVAQHTIALILNLLTSQTRYLHDVQQGYWSNSEVFCLLDHPIIETSNKILGIIGYGTLGRKVAAIAEVMDMRVLLCQRPGAEGDPEPGRVNFDELLERSDIISLHCPLNTDTYHLFDDQAFRKMKKSAILVNTARGAIIDSAALINALENGEIAGAGIDVLDLEPPPPDHPLLQSRRPDLLITPHNAWGSRETRQRLVNALSENLIGWLNDRPVNVVS